MSMTIRFWGVRGSVPSPGPETALVGGNTSCVELVARDGTSGSDQEHRVVLDAGTGLRRLGNALLASGRAVDATVLLSHVHWDHIQGIPFFAPIYLPGTRLRFVGGSTLPVREALHAQMRKPHFPVDMGDVAAQLAFEDVRDRARFDAGPVAVTAARANHPDAVFAYRLEHGGRSVVYATDTEHYACVDPRLVALARGADVLIYDAQYLPEEYAGEVGPTRVGWGHSTWEAGVALAHAAGVGKLVLFHHDPSRTDDGVRAIEARAQEAFRGEVVAAREGDAIELGAAARDAAA